MRPVIPALKRLDTFCIDVKAVCFPTAATKRRCKRESDVTKANDTDDRSLFHGLQCSEKLSL